MSKFTDEQIRYMVMRFLGWKLPKDFRPDCGIKFDADAAKKLNPNNATYEPSGTNLFDSGQADDMVRFMVDGIPHFTNLIIDDEAMEKMARAMMQSASVQMPTGTSDDQLQAWKVLANAAIMAFLDNPA